MIEVKVKSAVPVYAVGIFCVIYGLIFPLYRITDILIAAVLSGIVYFLCSKLIPDTVVLKPEPFVINKTGNSQADEVIEKGKEYIAKLNDLNQAISEPKMNRYIDSLGASGRKIFDFISKNPESARQLRTFINYYFPTTIKLLEDYKNISNEKIQGNNIDSTLDKIENVMETIEKAFHSQLDDLYQNKALDVSADIAVLESLLVSEGLQGGMKL